MKIPKKIDALLKRRTKLAKDLDDVCFDLDTWLDKKRNRTGQRLLSHRSGNIC